MPSNPSPKEYFGMTKNINKLDQLCQQVVCAQELMGIFFVVFCLMLILFVAQDSGDMMAPVVFVFVPLVWVAVVMIRKLCAIRCLLEENTPCEDFEFKVGCLYVKHRITGITKFLFDRYWYPWAAEVLKDSRGGTFRLYTCQAQFVQSQLKYHKTTRLKDLDE